MRIHEMVNRGKFPNCSTIAGKLEVNRKTIQRDINFMRDELDLPVEYSDANHGYHYTRPVSEFPLLKTTAEDLVSLILARNALGPLRGSALESTLRSGFQRLQSSMSDQVTIPWTDLDQAFSVKSMGMTKRDVFLFNRLAEAVLESREIRFEYRKLNSTESEKRRLQPYHLAEIDGGWYVIGNDLDRDAKRTFAVQRMKAVSVTQRRFVRPSDFRLRRSFCGKFRCLGGHGGKKQKLPGKNSVHRICGADCGGKAVASESGNRVFGQGRRSDRADHGSECVGRRGALGVGFWSASRSHFAAGIPGSGGGRAGESR